MVFSRNGRYSKNMRFVYEEKKLEIVKEFKYLGVIFKNNGRFTSAVKHIKAQGNKAMRYLLWKTKSTDMPIDIKLKLYDTLVRPILLYGAEIWGFENSAILEKVELQYFKLLLNLRKSTPNYMIYGELGRLPISITVKTRLISFWGKLILGKESKLSYRLYNQYCKNHELNRWMYAIKGIFDKTGLSIIWNLHCFSNYSRLVDVVKSVLRDQFIQQWECEMNLSHKGKTYKMMKGPFQTENYFTNLPYHLTNQICKFRTSNHKLPVETGRWSNIDYEKRKCDMCKTNEVGNEYHVLLKCKALLSIREKYIPEYFHKYPSLTKFETLMNKSSNRNLEKNIAKFLREMFSYRKINLQ